MRDSEERTGPLYWEGSVGSMIQTEISRTCVTGLEGIGLEDVYQLYAFWNLLGYALQKPFASFIWSTLTSVFTIVLK